MKFGDAFWWNVCRYVVAGAFAVWCVVEWSQNGATDRALLLAYGAILLGLKTVVYVDMTVNLPPRREEER